MKKQIFTGSISITFLLFYIVFLQWFCVEFLVMGDLPYEKEMKQTANFVKEIWEDVHMFPVEEYKSIAFAYEDSYGQERTFGGDRQHEGTDIIPPENKAGKYKIVSVSDGVIENIGWLPLGGWRIGIRSEQGIYFYYAHLHHFEEGLQEGTKVKAGDVIGYMGDSGYGQEGTTGKFVVHLHFGIYREEKGEEISVNPYWILKNLEEIDGKAGN